MQKRLLIGVSSCLLGEKVRFDGGHKRDNYLCEFLSAYADFYPICPEVAIGMGIPRPAIRLVGNPQNPRLLAVNNPEQDYTESMLEFAKNSMNQFKALNGYILKSKSPSCGWKRVNIYQEKGKAPAKGQGLFAKILEQSYPCMPIEEEGRLNDARLRENFVERLFLYKEWQDLTEEKISAASLIEFHTRHKLTLMAHHPDSYRLLGKKLSNLKTANINLVAQAYIQLFMKAMTYLATPKKHANVLQHCISYLKRNLGSADKQELLAVIDKYRCTLLPLIVPITLIKHHLNHFPQPYLMQQSYLNPYPEELMLRNHI